MLKYALDKEKSKEIYDYFKDRITVKECYNNVFNVVSASPKTFRSGKWKAAYVYMTVFENLLCRHCFIIGENGKVIDPTIFAASHIREDRQYFTMKVFDDIETFFEAIEQDNYYPALDRYLKDDSKAAQKWAAENGYILTG